MKRSSVVTVEDYLEKYQPDMEDSVMHLIKLIYDDAPASDLKVMADYISEFFQDDDPVSQGWVGANGLP